MAIPPRRVIIGRAVLNQLPKLISELKLELPIGLIAGRFTSRFAASFLDQFDPAQLKLLICDQQPSQALDQALQALRSSNPGCLVGLGGGRIIDLAKLLGSKLKLPVISIPTNASHDGIASPRANPARGQPSIPVNPPIAVIADLELICSAPARYLSSGAGDLIANYTACLDWELAHRELGERLDPRAYRISMDCALRMMQLAEAELIQDKLRFAQELVSKLIDSGIAMCLVDSSRPASGSEHKFSHALDRILHQPGLHGEQCGLGTIMMSYLHQQDWERVRDCLRKLGAPVNSSSLGISPQSIIQALSSAHQINPERYTILRNGLHWDEAAQLAKRTQVI